MSLIQEISALEIQEQTISANVPLDVVQLKNIQSQLAAKRAELEQQQSAQQLQQKEEQHTDGLIDVANQIFTALFPKDKYTEILGLNNYEDKQQRFNQLYHAATSEYSQPLIDSYKDEITKRDDKIKTLTQQGIETENQLADVKKQLDKAIRDRDDHSAARKLAEDDLANLKAARAQKDADHASTAASNISLTEENKKLQTDNANLKQQINELQSQLAAAQKPAAKPSAAFSELLEQTKKASESLDTKVARGLDRWSQILPDIVPPPVPPVSQEGQFPNQTEDRTAELADSETPELPAVGQVTEEQFPSSGDSVEGANLAQPYAGSETSPESDAPVSRTEFDAVVKRVEVLENVASLVGRPNPDVQTYTTTTGAV